MSAPRIVVPPAVIQAAAVLTLCVPLAAQRQFGELQREHLPTLQGAGVGPVVADFDGDGADDLFYAGQVRALLLRQRPGVFADASDLLPRRGGLRDRDAAALDYDGDGDPDLLIAVNGRESLLYRNDGVAGFVDVTAVQPWAQLSPPPSTTVVAVGDLNGDGVAEVLLAGDDREDRIFNGQVGGFSFCPFCQPAPLRATRAALLEDFDGDGDLDLLRIVEPGGASTGFLYETNDGLGHWTVAASGTFNVASGPPVGAVAIDQDHDGDQDVLVWGQGFGPVLLSNDAGQRFNLAASPMASLLGIRSMAVLDRDGDGLEDLLVTSAIGTALLRGTIGGRFLPFRDVSLPAGQQPSYAGGVLDADGDGDLDIALGTGQLELWFDEGGRFVRSRGTELTDVRGSVALGDVDGDGDLDALLGGSAEGNRIGRILLNDGDGRFVAGMPLPAVPGAVQPGSYAILLHDLDGDGALDVLVGQGGGQPVLFPGRGDGTFRRGAPGNLPAVTTPQAAFAVGDIDADGDVDLVIAGSGLGGTTNAVRVLLGDGSGMFQHAPAGSVPALFELVGDVELADADGDGDPDILLGVANRTVGTSPRLWANDGTGRFTDVAGALPTTPWYDMSVTVADWDADGDLDVVTGQSLLQNDGTGTFTDVTQQLTDFSVGIAPAFADVDLDGDLDLLCYNTFFRQQADGRFRFDVSLAGPQPPRVYAVGDVDGDGDPDLVGAYVLQRNLHKELEVPELPRVGGALRVVVHSEPTTGPAGQVALLWLGAQRAVRPIDLGALGSFRLDPAQIVLSQPVLLLTGGRGEASIPVPNQVSLAGADAHLQALVLGATYPDWRLTRAETVTILR